MTDERVLVTERCTIDRWRGYRTSIFFVSLDGETAFLESKPFPWRKTGPPPETGPAREAYDQLVAALEALGWAREDGTGGDWYAARFTRLVERAAPAEPPAEEPVEEPAPKPVAQPVPAPVMAVVPEPEPEPVWIEPASAAVEPAVAVDETGLWMDPPLPVPELVERRPERPPPTVLAAVPDPEPPAPRRRRPRTIVLVGGLGACIAAGSLALGAAGLGSKHSRTIFVPVADAARPAATATAKPKPQSRTTAHRTSAPQRRHAAAPRTVELSITATQSSWLELRHGSATGSVLYAGRLDAGRSLRLRAGRIWARFGSAGNLTIFANGRRVNLMGTFEHVFTPPAR